MPSIKEVDFERRSGYPTPIINTEEPTEAD
jgi:hypothetical protein